MGRRIIISSLLVLLALTLSALATKVYVSGDRVSGRWDAGDTVVVRGDAEVPDGETLYIQPGVVVYFDSLSSFLVHGGLMAEGDQARPIQVYPTANWRGFHFEGSLLEIRRLRHVEIPADAPTPRIAVVGESSSIEITGCSLRGDSGCVIVTGGRLWASNNYFVSTLLHTATVTIRDLRGWETADDSLVNNVIIARVPGSGSDMSHEFTCGLFIERSTTLRIRNNTIIVSAPRKAIGAYFGAVPDGGDEVFSMEHCVVAVAANDGVPFGVCKQEAGELEVIQCTIDVSDTCLSAYKTPVGVWADAGTVRVNSSIVVVDRCNAYFDSKSGGEVQVRYSMYWSTLTARLPSLDDGELLSCDPQDTSGYAWDGDYTNIYADPLLIRNTEWGQWESQEEIEQYYSLNQESPCIDRADAEECGMDPDGSQPDIGRYYFPRTTSGGQDSPDLPRGFRLLSSYPNPFNSVATIPFVIASDAEVRVAVFDVLGREVVVLVQNRFAPGEHRVLFSGDDLPSGCYIAVLSLNGRTAAAHKLLLLK